MEGERIGGRGRERERVGGRSKTQDLLVSLIFKNKNLYENNIYYVGSVFINILNSKELIYFTRGYTVS